MTTPPKPIEDTQAIPADVRAIAKAAWAEADGKVIYADAVDVIAQAILAERQSDEWLLIETAPHETNVLLAWLDSSFTGQWVMEAGMASWGWRRGGVSNMSRHGQATHWKHLPSPPKTDNQKGNNRFSRKGE